MANEDFGIIIVLKQKKILHFPGFLSQKRVLSFVRITKFLYETPQSYQLNMACQPSNNLLLAHKLFIAFPREFWRPKWNW